MIRSMENNRCDKMAVSKDDSVAVTKDKTEFYICLLSIVFTNILVIVIALKNSLVITDIIWVYWCEGVIIGCLLLFKVACMSCSSIELLKKQRDREFDLSEFITTIFVCGQIPLQVILVKWIYSIDSIFDYANALAVMGSIILGKEIFLYFRDSRPWEEPGEVDRMAWRSFIFFIRFIPLIAIYHYMVKTQVNEEDIMLLSVEFMLLNFASEIIAFFIEIYIRKKGWC